MDQKSSYIILINESAGTVLREGAAHIEDLIAKGEADIEAVHFLPMSILLEEAQEHTINGKKIIVGGGDGTLRAAAQTINGAFGVLPLGTMNLLAKDLGVPDTIEDALKEYAKGYQILDIDVAYVNNEPFYCSAAIGLIPRSAEYREEHRHDPALLLLPQLGISVLDHMDVAKYGQSFYMTMDGRKKTLHTSNLIITNNEYEYVNGAQSLHFRRHTLENNKLGVYATRPRSFWDKIRILAHFKFGDWTKDPAIKSWICETMSVQYHKKEIMVSLDGENMTLETPLNFWIKPKSRPILIPRAEEKEEERA